MAKPLIAYTIGYEGRQLDEFIESLQQRRIEVLIDIREIPFSRKPGFSKSLLQEALGVAGIQYLHVKALGSPKHIRYDYKSGGDKETFFTAYRAYLRTQLAYLRTVLETVRHQTACLMCLERHAMDCHRSATSEMLKELDGNGLTFKHI
jgi:uncharacterized protein (DUF488 family)